MELDRLLLAIEDVVPVVLSGIGLWLLARTAVARGLMAGRLALAGTVLIVGGGATKPIYKAVTALGDSDPLVLDDLLFWFLAPGFLVFGAGLALATADAARSALAAALAAVAALMVAGALLVGGSAGWFALLLAVATVGNVWVVVMLVRWSLSIGDRTAAWLFIGNVAIVFGLSWAAATLVQTIGVQWAEQLSSTVAQALFLIGSIRISRATLDFSAIPRPVRPFERRRG